MTSQPIPETDEEDFVTRIRTAVARAELEEMYLAGPDRHASVLIADLRAILDQELRVGKGVARTPQPLTTSLRGTEAKADRALQSDHTRLAEALTYGGQPWAVLRESHDFIDLLRRVFPERMPLVGDQTVEHHGLDNDRQVLFYEQDFYVLSNFSSFSIMWKLSEREGLGRFDTSEALYHWLKFSGKAQPFRVPTTDQHTIACAIRAAPSAHEAFKVAERHKSHRRRDWDEIKVDVMKMILRAKAGQHEYVRRKLLVTGDRELIENSWRDDFWGWGPNRDGQNMLGKLWMEVRAELRGQADV